MKTAPEFETTYLGIHPPDQTLHINRIARCEKLNFEIIAREGETPNRYQTEMDILLTKASIDGSVVPEGNYFLSVKGARPLLDSFRQSLFRSQVFSFA